MNDIYLDAVERMLAASGPRLHTEGMVALIPRVDQAEQLAVRGFEPASELHLTLSLLGEAENYDDSERLRIISAVASAASYVAPVPAEAWAVAEFNPHTSSRAAVYLVGRGPLEVAKSMLAESFYSEKVPEQYRPWIPHVTIGYGAPLAKLIASGTPLVFDKVRVAFAGQYNDFDLTGTP